MTNECTSVVGRFDSHGGAPEWYRWHCPMQYVQGYPRSHWTPPSGDYLLCIAPAAARATSNESTTKNWPTLLAISMAAAVRQYSTACIPQWRRSRALVGATGRHHWASIAANSCNQSHVHCFFQVFSLLTCRKKVTGQREGPCFQ